MELQEFKQLVYKYSKHEYRNDTKLYSLNAVEFKALLFQLKFGHFSCIPFSTKSFIRNLLANYEPAFDIINNQYTLKDFQFELLELSRDKVR